jgi:hypothetical protein
MIKWYRDLTYFIALEPELGAKVNTYAAVAEFKLKYECTEDPNWPQLFTCSEENFLLIKLTCPEVILGLCIQ